MKKVVLFIFGFICMINAYADLSINPATLPNGITGHNYAATLSGTGGQSPYTFATTAGTLPTGLYLSGSNFFGVPTATVTTIYTFTITVTDAASATAAKGYTVTAAPSILTPNQLVNLWLRSTPDRAGLTDTWFSTGTGTTGQNNNQVYTATSFTTSGTYSVSANTPMVVNTNTAACTCTVTIDFTSLNTTVHDGQIFSFTTIGSISNLHFTGGTIYGGAAASFGGATAVGTPEGISWFYDVNKTAWIRRQ